MCKSWELWYTIGKGPQETRSGKVNRLCVTTIQNIKHTFEPITSIAYYFYISSPDSSLTLCLHCEWSEEQATSEWDNGQVFCLLRYNYEVNVNCIMTQSAFRLVPYTAYYNYTIHTVSYLPGKGVRGHFISLRKCTCHWAVKTGGREWCCLPS